MFGSARSAIHQDFECWRGRKLQWHHHMSNGTVTFANRTGKFDLEVTTFQMAVLFCWENRREDKISLENLRLATELPDSELRKTLWSLVAFPKLKRQVLLYEPVGSKVTEWIENAFFTSTRSSVWSRMGKFSGGGASTS
jgi:cullin-5